MTWLLQSCAPGVEGLLSLGDEANCNTNEETMIVSDTEFQMRINIIRVKKNIEVESSKECRVNEETMVGCGHI